MKNILFILNKNNIPAPTGNGDKVLVSAICNLMLKLDYRVHLLILSAISEEEKKIALNDFVNSDRLSIDAIVFDRANTIRSEIYDIVFPKKSGTLLSLKNISLLENFILSKKIDIIFGYNIEPIIAMSFLDFNGPKIAFMVDLLEHFYRRRWQLWKKNNLKQKIRNGISFLAQHQNIAVFNKALVKIDHVVEHAHNHFLELREKGFENVTYIPHPLPIVPFSQSYFKDSKKFIVLIVGSFKGVASRLGQEFFFAHVLPHYEKISNGDYSDIEFRFVGHGEMPIIIKEKVNASHYCKFVGFVDNLEAEWFNADVVLVTIPIEHGFRTRIAEAMNYGKCVIAHTSNSKGMPELVHNFNCFMSTEGIEIAEFIMRVKKDGDLKIKIGENAKITFIERICGNAAIDKIKDIVNSIDIRKKK